VTRTGRYSAAAAPRQASLQNQRPRCLSRPPWSRLRTQWKHACRKVTELNGAAVVHSKARALAWGCVHGRSVQECVALRTCSTSSAASEHTRGCSLRTLLPWATSARANTLRPAPGTCVVTARVKVVISQCSTTASVHIASAQRSAWAGTCPDVKHGCCTSSQTNNSVCQDQNTPLQGTPHLLDLNGFLSKPLLQGAADMRRQRPACAPPASAADRSAAQHAPRALCLSRGVIVCNLWVTTNSRPLEANACNEQLCS
jgi:hypothetical protein